MCKIINIKLITKKLPLLQTYLLSYGEITEFRANIISIKLDDGNSGISESIALPGYGTETDDQLKSILLTYCKLLVDKEIDEAIKLLNENYIRGSFAFSTILSALEIAKKSFIPPNNFEIPVAGIISTNDKQKILSDLRNLTERGYRTIKVKLGKNIKNDIENIESLLEYSDGDINFRFDANQAYDFNETVSLLEHVKGINQDKIQLFEQPMDIYSWKEYATLSELFETPIMLDESIFTEKDIDKAADVGASFVKLKLCKHRGINNLIYLAEKASALGMKVILGNGIATDISNLIELWLYAAKPNLFFGAIESNGFLKLNMGGLLPVKIIFNNGHLLWDNNNDEGSTEEFHIQ